MRLVVNVALDVPSFRFFYTFMCFLLIHYIITRFLSLSLNYEMLLQILHDILLGFQHIVSH